MFNPIIPGVLKTNKIPGGSRSPPYENDEGVLLGPYPQKTFWKRTNFRLVWKKIGAQSQKLAEILRFWKIGPKLANFLKRA